ncbi:NAD-binding protein [Phellopilus nigrolimitatus]|nr:NAD-binding protein [Phellopilus nigrolimitatus]
MSAPAETNAARNIGESPAQHTDVYDAISPARLAGSMAGKVILVTGAGRGIGRAIALAFAARAPPTIAELHPDTRTLVCTADATDSAAVAAALEKIAKELGPLDVVVPNAAITVFRPFAYTPWDEWWRVMEVNLKAPLMLAHMALDGMRARKSGALVFISSRAAVTTVAGPSSYCASKTALLRAVACLQRELDMEFEGNSGIHAYSLHPGRVKTDMAFSNMHPDMEKMQKGFSEIMRNAYENYVDTPELCGWTCVYLATGRAAQLRGRYLDVEQNIEDVVRQADIVQKENMYDLTVGRLGGEGFYTATWQKYNASDKA